MYGGGALALVFVLLYAFPQAFNAWKKFAIWFIPLAALLFVFYPNPGSGDFLSPMPEQVFQWVSVLYVAVSGLIIGLKSKPK
jgi:beta-lactamase regulating signal transducer with metallopeptidase domain